MKSTILQRCHFSFQTVIKCGFLWKNLPLEPLSALTCSYFYPHRVEQWISIPVTSLISNSFMTLKATPTASRHISSPVCPVGLDSVSSPPGGILYCRDCIIVLHMVLSFQTQTFGAVPVITSCHSELHPPIQTSCDAGAQTQGLWVSWIPLSFYLQRATHKDWTVEAVGGEVGYFFLPLSSVSLSNDSSFWH